MENDGPLVATDVVDGLFERFRRGVDGAVPRARNDGHGLGLSIAQAVVATHDGTIALRPRVEGGMSVEVSLPCEAPVG